MIKINGDTTKLNNDKFGKDLGVKKGTKKVTNNKKATTMLLQ